MSPENLIFSDLIFPILVEGWPVSVDGIATRYRLEGQGIVSDIPHTCGGLAGIA